MARPNPRSRTGISGALSLRRCSTSRSIQGMSLIAERPLAVDEESHDTLHECQR